jgi:hypothetical protein
LNHSKKAQLPVVSGNWVFIMGGEAFVSFSFSRRQIRTNFNGDLT